MGCGRVLQQTQGESWAPGVDVRNDFPGRHGGFLNGFQLQAVLLGYVPHVFEGEGLQSKELNGP